MKTVRVAATTATGVMLSMMLCATSATAQTLTPLNITDAIGVDLAEVAGNDLQAVLRVDDSVLDKVKSSVEDFFGSATSNRAVSEFKETAESLVTEFAPTVDKDTVRWNFNVDELASAYGKALDKQMVLVDLPEGIDPASVNITRGTETIETALDKDARAVTFSASAGDELTFSGTRTKGTPGQLSALALPVTGEKLVLPVVDVQNLLDAVSYSGGAGKPVEFAGIGVGLDEPIVDVTEQLFAGELNVADITAQLQNVLKSIDPGQLSNLLDDASNALADVVGSLGNLSSNVTRNSSNLSSNLELPELNLPERNVPELNGSSGSSTIGGTGDADANKEFSITSLTSDQLRSAVNKLDRVEDLEKVRRELASTPEAIVLNAEKIKIVDDRIEQVAPVDVDSSTTNTGATNNTGTNSGNGRNTDTSNASGERYITGVRDGQVITSDGAMNPVSNKGTATTVTENSTATTGAASRDDIMTYDEYRGVTEAESAASDATSTDAESTTSAAEPSRAGGADDTPQANHNDAATDELALTGVSDDVGSRTALAAGLALLTLLSFAGIVVLKRRS